jgi:hypothetical protein
MRQLLEPLSRCHCQALADLSAIDPFPQSGVELEFETACMKQPNECVGPRMMSAGLDPRDGRLRHTRTLCERALTQTGTLASLFQPSFRFVHTDSIFAISNRWPDT